MRVEIVSRPAPFIPATASLPAIAGVFTAVFVGLMLLKDYSRPSLSLTTKAPVIVPPAETPTALFTFAPASPADAVAHFSSLLRFETDCWDVHASLAQHHDSFVVLDVRSPAAYAAGHVHGAINLPLSQMRQRYRELPSTRGILVYCGVGQRAYFATRFLNQHGYRARNLSGGFTTYQAIQGR